MRVTKRVAIVGATAVLGVLGTAGTASAHLLVVSPSGGGGNSQYIGGAGVGHTGGPTWQGHLAACAGAELHGNGTVDFVDNHFGTCNYS